MAKRSEERKQFLSDIIIGAIEGGTGYWAECTEYHWQGRETDVIAKIKDEETGQEYDLNNDVIARGVSRITEDGFQVRKDILSGILLGNRSNDAGEIDAEGSDVIVQAALFGEIVYG